MWVQEFTCTKCREVFVRSPNKDGRFQRTEFRRLTAVKGTLLA